MANIVVFWGRKHHAEKLVAVCTQLENMGHTIAVVLCDNSVNIDPSTEFVHEYTNNFIHLNEFARPDTPSGAEDDIKRILTETINPALSLCSPFFYVQSIIEASRNVRSFSNLMDAMMPDAVVVLHSNNFFVKPLLWKAQKDGVHTFAFQEGMLRHRDQETLNKQATAFEFINTMFTWYPGDKESYVSAGIPEDAIVPVGPVHMDAVILADRPQMSSFVLSYFLPLLSEFKGSWERDLRRLRAFAFDHGIRVVAKFHPFDYYILNRAKEIFDSEFTAVYEGSSLKLTLNSSMIATGHSTTRLEAMILNKPVVELDFDNHGILEPYHEQGMAFSATNEEELLQAIRDSNKLFPAVQKFRMSTQQFNDGQAALRAAQKITEILDR